MRIVVHMYVYKYIVFVWFIFFFIGFSVERCFQRLCQVTDFYGGIEIIDIAADS